MSDLVCTCNSSTTSLASSISTSISRLQDLAYLHIITSCRISNPYIPACTSWYSADLHVPLNSVMCKIYKVKFQLLDSIYKYANEIGIADVIKHRHGRLVPFLPCCSINDVEFCPFRSIRRSINLDSFRERPKTHLFICF